VWRSTSTQARGQPITPVRPLGKSSEPTNRVVCAHVTVPFNRRHVDRSVYASLSLSFAAWRSITRDVMATRAGRRTHTICRAAAISPRRSPALRGTRWFSRELATRLHPILVTDIANARRPTRNACGFWLGNDRRLLPPPRTIGLYRSEHPGPSYPRTVVMEYSSMPNTYKSPSFIWLTTLGLFGLTGLGVIGGAWLLLFLLVTLATPVLIVMTQHRVGVIARSRKRPRVVANSRDQSPWDPDWIDVYRWESEGGAPRMTSAAVFCDSAKLLRHPSLSS